MPPSPWMVSMQTPQTSVGELLAKVFDIVEAHEVDLGHDGCEGHAVHELVGGRDRAYGASVEAVFEREKAGAELAAFGAVLFRVGAGELERGLPGLGAGVAEEDAVESADLGEAQRKLNRAGDGRRGSRCAAATSPVRRGPVR